MKLETSRTVMIHSPTLSVLCSIHGSTYLTHDMMHPHPHTLSHRHTHRGVDKNKCTKVWLADEVLWRDSFPKSLISFELPLVFCALKWGCFRRGAFTRLSCSTASYARMFYRPEHSTRQNILQDRTYYRTEHSTGQNILQARTFYKHWPPYLLELNSVANCILIDGI